MFMSNQITFFFFFFLGGGGIKDVVPRGRGLIMSVPLDTFSYSFTLTFIPVSLGTSWLFACSIALGLHTTFIVVLGSSFYWFRFGIRHGS